MFELKDLSRLTENAAVLSAFMLAATGAFGMRTNLGSVANSEIGRNHKGFLSFPG